MRESDRSSTVWMLVLGTVSVLPFSACTTTSNLSAISNSNIQAVNRIAQEPAAEAPQEETTPEPSDTIVGTPETLAQPDPVAIERPAPSKPPILLASVPRTPVESRPTNQIMMVRTTAYSHLQADSLPYGRKSAAGNDLQYGSRVRSAAADWSKYPLGTRFMIEGLPYEYVIDDYGSALCGTETIDIYKPNLAGIGQWGARNVPIKVLEWGSFEESRKILDSRKHVKHAHHVRKMLYEIEKKGKAGYLTPTSGGNA
ncbi:MAG: hypothetical protein CMO55_03935 [Verrucomicrobiales bacterium]|nr:hypothetical protein [Verrucomicrobiales bacterium]